MYLIITYRKQHVILRAWTWQAGAYAVDGVGYGRPCRTTIVVAVWSGISSLIAKRSCLHHVRARDTARGVRLRLSGTHLHPPSRSYSVSVSLPNVTSKRDTWETSSSRVLTRFKDERDK